MRGTHGGLPGVHTKVVTNRSDIPDVVGGLSSSKTSVVTEGRRNTSAQIALPRDENLD
jgi:hypothetical protein